MDCIARAHAHKAVWGMTPPAQLARVPRGGEWSGPRGTFWHPKWHLTTTNFGKHKRRKGLQGATRILIMGAISVAPSGTRMAPSRPAWHLAREEFGACNLSLQA